MARKRIGRRRSKYEIIESEVSHGLNYREWANKVAEILWLGWNIILEEVPDFNIYSHFKLGVKVDDAVKICMGVLPSPYDFEEISLHPSVENEFFDDYAEDNFLYEWEINALKAYNGG